jgi:hypothetical protein
MNDQPKEPNKGYEFTYVKASIGWGSVVISWVAKGIGFGETAIYIENRKIKIDTECMSKEFCDAVVSACVCRMKEDEDEEKERLEEFEQESTHCLNSIFVKTMYENVSWETDQK